MLFDWDPDKAKKNLRKHKVSFEMASTIFSDPFHLSIMIQTQNKKSDG